MHSASRIQMASSSKFSSLSPPGTTPWVPDLLSDDEYRLLRQNAFEEYSANAAIPTEAPVVPIKASGDVHLGLHTPVPGMCSFVFLDLPNSGWHIL